MYEYVDVPCDDEKMKDKLAPKDMWKTVMDHKKNASVHVSPKGKPSPTAAARIAEQEEEDEEDDFPAEEKDEDEDEAKESPPPAEGVEEPQINPEVPPQISPKAAAAESHASAKNLQADHAQAVMKASVESLGRTKSDTMERNKHITRKPSRLADSLGQSAEDNMVRHKVARALAEKKKMDEELKSAWERQQQDQIKKELEAKDADRARLEQMLKQRKEEQDRLEQELALLRRKNEEAQKRESDARKAQDDAKLLSEKKNGGATAPEGIIDKSDAAVQETRKKPPQPTQQASEPKPVMSEEIRQQLTERLLHEAVLKEQLLESRRKESDMQRQLEESRQREELMRQQVAESRSVESSTKMTEELRRLALLEEEVRAQRRAIETGLVAQRAAAGLSSGSSAGRPGNEPELVPEPVSRLSPEEGRRTEGDLNFVHEKDLSPFARRMFQTAKSHRIGSSQPSREPSRTASPPEDTKHASPPVASSPDESSRARRAEQAAQILTPDTVARGSLDIVKIPVLMLNHPISSGTYALHVFDVDPKGKIEQVKRPMASLYRVPLASLHIFARDSEVSDDIALELAYPKGEILYCVALIPGRRDTEPAEEVVCEK